MLCTLHTCTAWQVYNAIYAVVDPFYLCTCQYRYLFYICFSSVDIGFYSGILDSWFVLYNLQPAHYTFQTLSIIQTGWFDGEDVIVVE